MTETTGGPRRPTGTRHFVERAIAAIGLAIVLTSLGFLAYQEITADDAPPNFRFRVVAVAPVSGSYLVRLEVVNAGDSTAATLRIRGSLSAESQIVEVSRATLDYAPARSSRRAGLYFMHDPRKYGIRIEAEGYEEP